MSQNDPQDGLMPMFDIYHHEKLQCCKKFYDEYDPMWGIPNAYIFLKNDGSRCPIHNQNDIQDLMGIQEKVIEDDK